MGKQARERAIRQRSEMLAHMAKFGARSEPFELEWVDFLVKLPRVRVLREDDEQLLRGGMKPNLCHSNCQRLEQKQQGTRAVHGWWVQGSMLVRHSVIQFDGNYHCVTPQLEGTPRTIEFIEDPRLSIGEGGLGFEMRPVDGIRPPDTLRSYPDAHAEVYARFLELVAGGTDPLQAFDQVAPFANEIMARALRS